MKKIALALLLSVSVGAGADKNLTGRGVVLNTLNSTKIEKTEAFFSWDIEEFVEYMSKQVDVNFIIHPNVYDIPLERTIPNPLPATVPSVAPNGDPANGLPAQGPTVVAPWAHIDLTLVESEARLPQIKSLRMPLKNLTAKQILDAAMISFESPLEWLAVDYGVIIMRGKEPNVVTRRFTLPPNSLQRLDLMFTPLGQPVYVPKLTRGRWPGALRGAGSGFGNQNPLSPKK